MNTARIASSSQRIYDAVDLPNSCQSKLASSARGDGAAVALKARRVPGDRGPGVNRCRDTDRGNAVSAYAIIESERARTSFLRQGQPHGAGRAPRRTGRRRQLRVRRARARAHRLDGHARSRCHRRALRPESRRRRTRSDRRRLRLHRSHAGRSSCRCCSPCPSRSRRCWSRSRSRSACSPRCSPRRVSPEPAADGARQQLVRARPRARAAARRRTGPRRSAAGVLLLALLAQFAGDFAASAVRERLCGGITIRELAREVREVYLIDLALAPLGLAVALAAVGHHWAVLLIAPLFGILRLFSKERRARLEQLIELGDAYRGTALVLGDVVEADDTYTGEHCKGVVRLALDVAEESQLDARQRATSSSAPCCTTSARSPSPRRSSTSPASSTSASGRSSRPTRSRVRRCSSGSAASCARSARSCAPRTSAGTAAATPTACAARRSRWRPASSPPATPSTR